jgi:glutamine amidotransferase
MKKVTIIDYGLGNLGSIANMVRKCGGTSEITADPQIIARAQFIILPGVGAFDTGMRQINRLGLFNLLRQKALEEKVPLLGICLGMQLLTEGSEEGQLPGLGLVNAGCKRLQLQEGYRVPHMGWSLVTQIRKSEFYNLTDPETRFYFVHSYHVVCEDSSLPFLTCDDGGPFTAAFEQNNIMGVQFHPEKSHSFGKELISGFLKI